jgi:hypothetical protein
MAYERIKTEHAGAKNGGGAWMTRAEAKRTAGRQRRRADQAEAQREAHDELASYLDKEAPSANEREGRWATANAREAIREERW